MYDGKDGKSFMDWITQVKKIAKHTQHLEIQIAEARTGGIVYKFIKGMPPPSIWNAVKKRLCQEFSFVATKSKQAHESILDPSLLIRLYRNRSSNSLTC